MKFIHGLGNKVPIVFAGILLCLSVFLSPFISELIKNIQNIILGKSLQVEDSSLCLSFDQLINYDYPIMISCMLKNQDADLPITIQLADESQSVFPDRYKLISYVEGVIIAKTDSSHACEIFSNLPSGTALLIEANNAYINNDYVKLEDYLMCLEKLNNSSVWLSPFELAKLYNGLGLYMKSVGKSETAKKYFEKAISTYPVIWSDPIISLAEIIYLENPDYALQFVLGYLNRTQDPKAVFDLSRQAGFYLELAGVMEGAYCAYQRALGASEKLPASLAPDEWIEDIFSRVDNISNFYKSEPDICTNYWESLMINP